MGKERETTINRDAFLRLMIANLARIADAGLGQKQMEDCITEMGLSLGAWAEGFYERLYGKARPLTVEQYARMVLDLKKQIGGEFRLAQLGPDRIVVESPRCPFGKLVRESPSLCHMTSSVFGGIAARNFGYGKVELRRKISDGDRSCEVCIYITKEAGAGEEGIEYLPEFVPPSRDTPFTLDLRERIKTLEDLVEEATKRRAGELAALAEIGGLVISGANLQETLDTLAYKIAQATGFEGVGIGLYDPRRREIHFCSLYSEVLLVMLEWRKGSRARLKDTPVLQYLLKEKEPLILSDPQNDPRVREETRELARRDGVKTAAIFPLVFRDRLIGALDLISLKKHRFCQEEMKLLSLLASQTAAVIENARLMENLRLKVKLLKETQEELVQSAKLAAMGRMSAQMVHEVRNPLSSIRMSLQGLKRMLRLKGNNRRRLEIATEEVERLEGLLKGVLDYARPSGYKFQRGDINGVVDGALKLVEDHVREKGISIVKMLARGPLTVRLDPEKMRQALLNLLKNAIEAMPGGGRITVATRFRPKGAVTKNKGRGRRSLIEVTVSDTGVGMEEKVLKRVFEPFFTTKGEGLGLGLAIVKAIVDQHGGSIQVNSRKGKGTRFTIHLPIPG